MPPHHDLGHLFPQIILFLLPCIQKFWVKGVQNKNIFDCRIHYPQCLSNLEAIGRKHFVKALPSEYSSSSTLRIFFSALPIFLIIFPQNIHLCPLNILLYWENHGVFIFHDDACPINRGFSSLWLVEELSNNKRVCIYTARMYKYCLRMSSVWSTPKEFFGTLCRTLVLSKTCKLTVIWTWLTF